MLSIEYRFVFRPGVHEFCVLGTDCLLRPDRPGRLTVHRRRQVQDTARLFLSAELVRRSVSLRHSDCPISARSVHDAGTMRPVQGQGTRIQQQQ